MGQSHSVSQSCAAQCDKGAVTEDTRVVAHPCRHVFHTQCIAYRFDHRINTCPLCLQVVSHVLTNFRGDKFDIQNIPVPVEVFPRRKTIVPITRNADLVYVYPFPVVSIVNNNDKKHIRLIRRQEGKRDNVVSTIRPNRSLVLDENVLANSREYVVSEGQEECCRLRDSLVELADREPTLPFGRPVDVHPVVFVSNFVPVDATPRIGRHTRLRDRQPRRRRWKRAPRRAARRRTRNRRRYTRRRDLNRRVPEDWWSPSVGQLV